MGLAVKFRKMEMNKPDFSRVFFSGSTKKSHAISQYKQNFLWAISILLCLERLVFSKHSSSELYQKSVIIFFIKNYTVIEISM